MSNNIYDILKTMQVLTEGKKVCDDCGKAKCACVNESAKPDFLDMDKDGDKKEPMKKAAKEKSKGAIAEAVARVEQQLAEKYMGFKKTAAAVAKGGSADDPEAVAAAIGRKKYGKKKFQAAAAAGKKLGEESEMKTTRIPVGVIDGPGGYEEAQKRIKDYEDGKINKDGKPLPPVEDRSKPAEKPKTKTVDEGEYNEDMLSPKQQKIARMAGNPKKIDANDLAALRAGKKKKAEGNAFSGALDAARDAGKSEFEVDGKTYKVQEGWDEMMADVKKRSGPQPQGGSGFKAGKRYGGAAQQDEPDTDNETGEVAKKTRGRPKKDKFAK